MRARRTIETVALALAAGLVAWAGLGRGKEPQKDNPMTTASQATSAATEEIHWLAWGPDVFKKALAEDKLIVLDSGATWCHWCHVMDRVTYEHPDVVRAVRGRGFLLGLELTGDREDFPRQSLLGLMAEQERLTALLSSYLLEVEGIPVFRRIDRATRALSAWAEYRRPAGE